MALTKPDLKKIKDLIHAALSEFYDTLIQTNYVTKTDLKQELSRFATKYDLAQLKEEVITGQDEILGEIKAMREESLMMHYRVYDQHQPQLEDHEKRISRLESVSHVA